MTSYRHVGSTLPWAPLDVQRADTIAREVKQDVTGHPVDTAKHVATDVN